MTPKDGLVDQSSVGGLVWEVDRDDPDAPPVRAVYISKIEAQGHADALNERYDGGYRVITRPVRKRFGGLADDE